MECSQVVDLLSEYLDGTLDPEIRERVESHLTACGRCALELDELQSCIQALGSMERMEAPPDFLLRVHERIEPRSLLRRLVHTLLMPLHIKLPLELAGLAAAVLIVFITVHKTYRAAETSKQAAPAKQMASEQPVIPLGSSHATTGDRPLELALIVGALGSTGKAKGEIAPAASATPKMSEWAPQVEAKAKDSHEPSSPRPLEREPAKPNVETRSPAADEAPVAYGSGEERGGHLFRSGSVDDRAVATDLAARLAVKGRTDNGETGALPPSPDPAVHGTLMAVQESVEEASGTILTVEYDEASRQPRSMLIKIPARSYPLLVGKLQLLGELHEPDPPPVLPEGSGPVEIRLLVRSEG